MEQTAPAKNARQRLMQTIIDLGSKAYNPSEPEESRAQARREFDDFVQRQAMPVTVLDVSVKVVRGRLCLTSFPAQKPSM